MRLVKQEIHVLLSKKNPRPVPEASFWVPQNLAHNKALWEILRSLLRNVILLQLECCRQCTKFEELEKALHLC